MTYSVQDIIKDVRIALEENEVSSPFVAIADNDTLSLNAIITQKLVHAVRSVTNDAPSKLLDGGKTFASTIQWETNTIGKGMGYTSLPDDFMRLVIFQMSDWRRPVIDPIQDSDYSYFLQKSKFSGIRGGVDKPVCAITTYSSGKVLEFYSCTGGVTVTVKVAKYIPYPSIANDSIDICPKLYIPVIYYTAGLVLTTYKDNDQASKLFTLAKDYIK